MIAKFDKTKGRISCRCGFMASVAGGKPNPSTLELLRAGSRFELMHAHVNPKCIADEDYVTLPAIRDYKVKLP